MHVYLRTVYRQRGKESTEVRLLWFCREVCYVVVASIENVIEGEGKIFQIDESHINTRKYQDDLLYGMNKNRSGYLVEFKKTIITFITTVQKKK